MTQKQIGEFVGFLSGEGCISIYDYSYKQYRRFVGKITIAQRADNDQYLLFLKDNLGGNVRYILRHKPSPSAQWILSNPEKLEMICKWVLSSSIDVKKKQAQTMLEFLEIKKKRKTYTPFTSSELVSFNRLVNKIKNENEIVFSRNSM